MKPRETVAKIASRMEGCLTLWAFPLFFPAPENNFSFPSWAADSRSPETAGGSCSHRGRCPGGLPWARWSKGITEFCSWGTFIGLAEVHGQPPCPLEAMRIFQVSEAGHSDGDTPPTRCKSQSPHTGPIGMLPATCFTLPSRPAFILLRPRQPSPGWGITVLSDIK